MQFIKSHIPIFKVIVAFITKLLWLIVLTQQLCIHRMTHSLPCPVGWRENKKKARRLMDWHKGSLEGEAKSYMCKQSKEGIYYPIHQQADVSHILESRVSVHVTVTWEDKHEDCECPQAFTAEGNIWCKTSLWSVQISCPSCFSSQLLFTPSLLTGGEGGFGEQSEKKKKHLRCESTVQQLPKHWFVSNAFSNKSKTLPLQADKKKTNSTPVSLSSVLTIYFIPFVSFSGLALSNTWITTHFPVLCYHSFCLWTTPIEWMCIKCASKCPWLGLHQTREADFCIKKLHNVNLYLLKTSLVQVQLPR